MASHLIFFSHPLLQLVPKVYVLLSLHTSWTDAMILKNHNAKYCNTTKLLLFQTSDTIKHKAERWAVGVEGSAKNPCTLTFNFWVCTYKVYLFLCDSGALPCSSFFSITFRFFFSLWLPHGFPQMDMRGGCLFHTEATSKLCLIPSWVAALHTSPLAI